jgi:capsid assembly protease
MEQIKNYPHLLSLIYNKPLMVTEDYLHLAMQFANTKLGFQNQSIPKKRLDINDDQDDDDFDELGYQSANGVAVIGIYGPLVPRATSLDMCQTMTSYENINAQLAAALADDSVSQIVFDIDSGGGSVAGAFECASKIAASTKPTTAIVNFSAYSAAYLLASACDQITISQTGGLGSIGVIAQHADMSKAYDEAGVKITTVFRGDNKNNLSPYEPLSDRSLEMLNALVDSSYQSFVSFVANQRGLDPQAVINTQAGLFEGQDAITAGLADVYADPQDALMQVVQSAARQMSPMLRIEEEAPKVQAANNLKLRAKALRMKF